MEAKEKAMSLFKVLTVQKYTEISGYYTDVEETKENCLVVCDEVIHVLEKHNPMLKFVYKYWHEVRHNILKIQV